PHRGPQPAVLRAAFGHRRGPGPGRPGERRTPPGGDRGSRARPRCGIGRERPRRRGRSAPAETGRGREPGVSDSHLVVELLIGEADAALQEARYQHAWAAASRAVQAAEQIDEPGLLVRALETEGSALRMLGYHAAALERYTQVLGLAETHPGVIVWDSLRSC